MAVMTYNEYRSNLLQCRKLILTELITKIT